MQVELTARWIAGGAGAIAVIGGCAEAQSPDAAPASPLAEVLERARSDEDSNRERRIQERLELRRVSEAFNAAYGDDTCVTRFMHEHREELRRQCESQGMASNIAGGCWHVAYAALLDVALEGAALDHCGIEWRADVAEEWSEARPE